ncbi:PH domain-containing protein [uncultured Draconibacterium sp.]|uniref:PH domain-containing protein n=1 Tax=uncultured Draconibacterium sp. TaxID=1573823 RepID=UPI0025F48AE0|nr:PH domain-containing protein [uncultured Draconibacterium sp.]
MNKPDLSVPSRQSIKGLVIIFIQGIRSLARMFWAVLVVVILQNNLLQHKAIILPALAAIFILLVIHTLLYYLNFYFYVKDDEFVLKKGYLRKQVLSIPLERIQSINTKQNLLQQALDVVALEIDTAGTAGKELKIHALEAPYAKALSALLKTKTTEETEANTSEASATKPIESVILKLEPIDLLKIGISENHIRTALIILAFGSQLFNQVQEVFQEKADEYSNEFMNFVSNSGWALILFLILFFAVVSFLFSLVKTVYKYYDFRLVKSEQAYQIMAGLVNKRNVLVPHAKIQEFSWATNPIKKYFGIYHIAFKQAVSMQNRKNQLVDAPGCLQTQLDLLKNDLFGPDELDAQHRFFSHIHYFRVGWFFSGILPVIGAAPFLFSFWFFWVSAVLWLAVSGFYCYLLFRKRYFQISTTQIRVSSGAVGQKWNQMELFKVQAVRFKQSFFQKRRSLASLEIMNAAGSISIPYISESLAKQMQNYLLYHTETAQQKWM